MLLKRVANKQLAIQLVWVQHRLSSRLTSWVSIWFYSTVWVLLRVVNIIWVTLLIIILHLLTICVTFFVITQQLSTTSTLLRMMCKYDFTQLFEWTVTHDKFHLSKFTQNDCVNNAMYSTLVSSEDTPAQVPFTGKFIMMTSHPTLEVFSVYSVTSFRYDDVTSDA